MNAYETSTTVGGQREIHLAGVSFQPGTEVEVIISPKTSDASPGANTSHWLGSLRAARGHARNDKPIGALKREGLYVRDSLR